MSNAGIAAEMEIGKAVRERVRRVPDHEDGSVAEDPENGLQETRLVVGIEVGGGFVEEQDGAVAEKFARQSKPEFFARRETPCGFGQHSVEPARKISHDGFGPRGVERREDRGIVRPGGAPEREIASERCRDKLRTEDQKEPRRLVFVFHPGSSRGSCRPVDSFSEGRSRAH